MFELSEQDLRLLRKAVKEGKVVLLLGAGASATSLNGQRENVKQSRALSNQLAEMGGFSPGEDSLSDVVQAVMSRVGEAKIHALFKSEYTRTTPSNELKELLNYSWYRIYTWNIDDTLENITHSVQRRRYFNGLKDQVADYEGIEYLHIIHLHGEALKPEHGFIFSSFDYNQRLNRNQHDWYRQAVVDYTAHVPVFIGSTLNEPILSAELDRARPSEQASLGTAFLITPDKLSEIKKAQYAARRIVVIEGTLKDFVHWLKQTLPDVNTPLEINRAENLFIDTIAKANRINKFDLHAASFVILHTWRAAKAKADELRGVEQQQIARGFLEGGPVTFAIAASDIPVWLSATTDLYCALKASIESADRMFLVYGQSGSGKTTALLQSLLKYSRENESKVFYEIRGGVKSLRHALELILKIHEDEHVIVYLGDAFVFGDGLSEDVLSFPKGRITLVTSARTSEWRQHIERRVGGSTTAFEFQRFVASDFAALIERLLKYVPAPKFKRMTPTERLRKLAQSQEQLLIALKETTASTKFTNVITDEYEKIHDDSAKLVFLIVGIATLARVGISRAVVREVFNSLDASISFDEAILKLEGIVSENNDGRLVARHELYVRHIIENVARFNLVIDAIVEILRSFTKFEPPVVRSVNRLDALLFKFLLNHNFIGDMARRRNEVDEGLRVYRSFEIEFQLDGHFWLQYGQYQSMFGDLEQAMDSLKKSIAAYPENIFAVHALADLQLRVALERPNYDAMTVALLGEAVETLEGLHAEQRSGADFYPIVTLAERHIPVLIKHGQEKSARAAAQRYFNLIQAMSRTDSQINRVKERIFRYYTLGTWD